MNFSLSKKCKITPPAHITSHRSHKLYEVQEILTYNREEHADYFSLTEASLTSSRLPSCLKDKPTTYIPSLPLPLSPHASPNTDIRPAGISSPYFMNHVVHTCTSGPGKRHTKDQICVSKRALTPKTHAFGVTCTEIISLLTIGLFSNYYQKYTPNLSEQTKQITFCFLNLWPFLFIMIRKWLSVNCLFERNCGFAVTRKLCERCKFFWPPVYNIERLNLEI